MTDTPGMHPGSWQTGLNMEWSPLGKGDRDELTDAADCRHRHALQIAKPPVPLEK